MLQNHTSTSLLWLPNIAIFHPCIYLYILGGRCCVAYLMLQCKSGNFLDINQTHNRRKLALSFLMSTHSDQSCDHYVCEATKLTDLTKKP